MPITYPITLPSTPGFRDISWQPKSAVGMVEAPYTYNQKIYKWDGQAREVVISLPPMDVTNAKLWMAAMYSLNGIQGTFYLSDSAIGGPAQISAYDAYSDILVKGAGQTGAVIECDGWPLSTIVLTKGDWVSIGDRLYTMTLGMLTDGLGAGNLTLWPDVLVAPAGNDPVLIGSDARGIFRLTGWPEMGFSVNRLMEGFSFTAQEAL